MVGQNSRIDVALPAQVALTELMPVLLGQLDGVGLHGAGLESGLAESGLAHGGWVLQRLGGAPLDEDSTPAELGLRDGELVFLRARGDEMPTVDYDDQADAIADQIRGRADRWRPGMTRWALRATATVSLLTGLGCLLLPGQELSRAIAAGSAAVLLIALATVLARAGRDTVVATMLGLGAASYAALAGWLLPQLADVPPGSAMPNAACAVLAATTTVAMVLTGVADAALIFVPLLLLLGVGVAGSAIKLVTELTVVESTAITLVLVLIIGAFLPMLSFRLAGLSLPQLPTGPENLGDDIEPIPATVMIDRAATADRYYSAFGSALAVAATGCLVVLGLGDGWASVTLCVVVCVLLLLRIRNLGGAWQRAAFVTPAMAGLVTLTLHWASNLAPLTRTISLPLLLAGVTAALLTGAALIPGKRLRPLWGRAADLLEPLCALATVPLMLAVLDVYAAVRAWAS
nr:Putative ESX-1 secretion system component Rv3877 [Kibdelosporangium sp. MJ126-NF4]